MAAEEAETHLLVTAAVLAGYGYPEEMSEIIKIKRASENDIEVAKNERDGNLTDAETNYIVSSIYADQIYIQGQAEVESLLNEATAKARAITARFQYIQDLFVLNKNINNFTASEFIAYWLPSFVLLNGTNPVTTTLSKDEYYIPPSSTPSPIVIGNTTIQPTVMTTTNSMTTQYFTSLSPTTMAPSNGGR